jgi:hypothetical protein
MKEICVYSRSFLSVPLPGTAVEIKQGKINSSNGEKELHEVRIWKL